MTRPAVQALPAPAKPRGRRPLAYVVQGNRTKVSSARIGGCPRVGDIPE